ncbi:MAG: hypothetical protein WBA68_07270 [Alteraurantiacibacter sp.]
MPGFGFGYARSPARLPLLPVAPPQSATVQPGEQWSGIAGSGFTDPPTDPVRTTAKPALRLLVPPRQVFTDRLLVGVAAYANDGGTLFDNVGLERVDVFFESDTPVSIPAPEYRSFTDANGRPVAYFGWWIELERPAGHVGYFNEAQLYFEAIPRDPTMQNRVIGPYIYLPSATLHDVEMEVAPSQPAIANTRYPTLDQALIRIKQLSPKNPRVRILEPGRYAIGDNGVSKWDLASWCSIEASVPGVVIGKSGYTTDAAAIQRVQRLPVRFAGANLALDFRDVTELQGGFRVWFDGCELMASGAGRENLRRGIPPTVGVWLVRGSDFGVDAWFTEATARDVHHCFSLATLARGCRAEGTAGDLFTDALCTIGCEVSGHDNAFWYSDHPMLTVSYDGPEATATLERSGGVGSSGAGGGVFTARWGANSASFAVGTTEAFHTGTMGDGYWPQDVADWLATLLGWSASVVDNRFAAAYAALPGGKGLGFPATDVAAAPVTLQAMFDGHADFFQQNNNAVQENIVLADNRATGLQAQGLFVSPTYWQAVGSRDIMVVNNALHFDATPSGYWDARNALSQFGREFNAQSHVVVAHNTLAGQAVLLRKAKTDCDFDAYCLMRANVFDALTWEAGVTDPDLALEDNHLLAGGLAPAGSSGTTSGGDIGTLLADAAAGDFAPQGELLGALASAVLEYDRRGTRRAAVTAKGAVAPP